MYKDTPVILAEHKIFEELFGKGFNMSGVMEWIDEKDLRYVSYSSVGKSGVVPGILIDKAVVLISGYGAQIGRNASKFLHPRSRCGDYCRPSQYLSAPFPQ